MARAKRHYIPGQIWHITHRCHKREFLLKFAKDRQRYLQWLFNAKKRYGLVILNYIVTSNHVHLLVVDDMDRDAIPNSIKLVAGRTGQEFNQRKNRKGAFWEDRYHATAVESGDHLLRCLAYIDLNMVRAGVVNHPTEWHFGGYNEIQEPRRKNILVNHDRLRQLIGFDTYEKVKVGHKKWVESGLRDGMNMRDDCWTRSVAVGSKEFIDNVKMVMGIAARGRARIEAGDAYQLREDSVSYGGHLGTEKIEIVPENTYTWD
jgi:putative transposase